MENEEKELKANLEKEKLNEAAEALKNMDFNSENYKELLELINRISALAASNKHEEEIEREEEHKAENMNQEEPGQSSKNDNGTQTVTTKEENQAAPIVMGKTVLPSFIILTKEGLAVCENYTVQEFNKESNSYVLTDGNRTLMLPAKTFETILSPEKAFPAPEKEKPIIAEENPAIVQGISVIPQFSMITQNGLKEYKGMKLLSHDKESNTYILGNETSSLSVSAKTFEELTKPERYEAQYDENTPAYEKLIESQYDDYFKQRDNTANNFRHNLSVYIRKEANNPLDAITIAKDIVSRMDKEEQKKTLALINQLKKDDESINQFIVGTYFRAIKEVPLNEEYIRQNRSEKSITRPFYDTMSEKGQLVDKDSTLRIGDTVKNIPFKSKNVLGHGSSKIYENLTVISATKEGNNIVLMDGNKSFYTIPRDDFLAGYNKQQGKQHKAEIRHQRKNEFEVER